MGDQTLLGLRRALHNVDQRSQEAFDKIEALALAVSETLAAQATKLPGSLALLEMIRDEAAAAMNEINSEAESCGVQFRDWEFGEAIDMRLQAGCGGAKVNTAVPVADRSTAAEACCKVEALLKAILREATNEQTIDPYEREHVIRALVDATLTLNESVLLFVEKDRAE